MTLNADFSPQMLGVSINGQSVGANAGTERIKGDPGFSPIVTVEDITGGHRVTITDEDGDHVFDVMDGENGRNGFTPEIFTRAVTIAAGSNAYADTTGTVEQPLITFEIPRGDKGDTGPGVSSGGAVGQVLKKKSGTDYDTEWGGLSSTDVGAIATPASPAPKDNLVFDNNAWSAKAAASLSQAIPYGAVDDTSTSTAFTATIPGITEYRDGTVMLLKNGVVTSASGFTININGLGAKPVYSSMAAATADTTIFNINYTMLFIYDEGRVGGGCWICYRGYNSDTNTIGYQIRTNSTVLKTTDKCRYYKIFFTSKDGTHWVPASADSTNSATSKKTVNSRPIDPFGRIVYTSATTSYAAEADVAAATIWQQYNLTLGYSFNRTGSALTLTTKTPVYVKCAPQTDGSAVMDADTPIVQSLPDSNDGKIYIWLGIATSATAIELGLNHPVYYHNGTGIRIWTGGA